MGIKPDFLDPFVVKRSCDAYINWDCFSIFPVLVWGPWGYVGGVMDLHDRLFSFTHFSNIDTNFSC